MYSFYQFYSYICNTGLRFLGDYSFLRSGTRQYTAPYFIKFTPMSKSVFFSLKFYNYVKTKD